MTQSQIHDRSVPVLGANPLSGHFATPGDEWLSQCMLVLAATALGRSTLEGLRPSPAVRALAEALRQLGARIEMADGAWHVHGLGTGGLLAPEGPLDLRATGAGAELMLGLLAPYDFAATIRVDPAARPNRMEPLIASLAQSGLRVTPAEAGGVLALRGAAKAYPPRQPMAAADARTTFALMLAGLPLLGETRIMAEPEAVPATGLFEAMGATVTLGGVEGETRPIGLAGPADLRARHLVVPGDPSSAAAAMVAALLVPGSDIMIENVLVSPERSGLIDALLAMSGDIIFTNQRQSECGPVADLRVRASRLRAMDVDRTHARTMADDIAALAVAATHAEGETRIALDGEAGRWGPLVEALVAAGVKARLTEGELTIGGEKSVAGGVTLATRGDALLGLSLIALGLVAREPVVLDDIAPIRTEFPDMLAAMGNLGIGLGQPKETR